MSDAANFVNNDIFSSIHPLNNMKNNYAGTSAPDNPVEGCRWFDTGTNQLKIYRGAVGATVGAAADPFPPGTIMPWIGGYMGGGANTGYVRVLGDDDTIAGANSHLNLMGWWVCDGTVPSEASSDIWNAAGRYLPNLTDDRFIQGDTAINAEAAGGSSTRAHTHAVDFDNKTSGPSSNWYRSTTDGAGTNVANHPHTHDWNLASVTSGAASGTENRPVFLSLFMIIRVL